MTATENQKIKSAQTLVELFENNPQKIVLVPAIALDLADVKTCLASILSAETYSKTSSSIVGQNTQQTRVELETAIKNVAATTFSYAARIKNETLKAKMKIKVISLSKMRGTVLPNWCREFAQEVRLHLDGMAAQQFNVTEATIKVIEDLVVVFESKSPKALAVKSFTKTKTKARVNHVKDMMFIIRERLLNTAVAFMSIDAEFYNLIVNAAKVQAAPVSSTQAKLVVKDKTTNAPVVNRAFTIPEINFSGVTDEKGVAVFKTGKAKKISIVLAALNPTLLAQPIVRENIKTVRGKTTTVEWLVE